MEKRGSFLPGSPHSPRLNCVPGPGLGKTQQNCNQLWPRRAAGGGGRVGADSPALLGGEGSGGGEGTAERGQKVCGQT